ncbi:MAG TPA: HPF/RaiA family ribosome-associated protein [Patescibacteria group bacterium]|nr:HPF/RaiA family ribosome-associated protein [Patescibacteria group bacterium]
MNILVHTGNHMQGREELNVNVADAIGRSLERFSDRISRIEVHLADENSSNKEGGDDKRCMIEARLDGMQPIAVTHHAASIDQAVRGATDKIKRTLDHHIDKHRDH